MTAKNSIPRDTRIDVFRALALLTIFVNHVPGTVFEHFTHKNLGFSDSAEAFVLISGMAVGLAYGRKFEAGNRLLLTLKAWRRAGVLYITHIVTTIATLAIFTGGALFFARPDLLKMINIEPLVSKAPQALLGLATLGHQLGYNNILPVYAALLLMVPILLLLAQISLRLMLALSGTLWLVAGVYQVAPINYPGDGVWFLNPLSWQFLFAIGLASVLSIQRGRGVAFNRLLAGAAAGYILLAFAWVRLPLWGVDTSFGLPAVLTGFDKTYLSLPRLLHVLSLAYLIAAIPALSNLARTGADHPLAVLGKHSLPVFVAGTLLAMAAQVLKAVSHHSFAYDAVLISTGIALQLALAYYLEWLPKIGWGGKKPAPAAAPAGLLAGAAKAQLY